ncbi:MAG TPA: YiiD C-terminal domain-containing protein [Thiolinea sp.]|nr:YiiD C-terminal domain-containing protein [Thiolinea sp.]
MQTSELETYIHANIPLTQAMQVSVLSIAPQQLVLAAPLQPNINPHHTVFGGSIATMLTLAAWCLLHTRLAAEGIANSLVVRQSSLDYDKPTAGDFKAVASLAEPEHWDAALAMLKQRGKAKIAVLAVLDYDGQITARFRGEFVALKSA